MTARRQIRPPRGACGRTSGRQTHRVDIKSPLAYPIRRFERAGSISTTTRATWRSIACSLNESFNRALTSNRFRAMETAGVVK